MSLPFIRLRRRSCRFQNDQVFCAGVERHHVHFIATALGLLVALDVAIVVAGLL